MDGGNKMNLKKLRMLGIMTLLLIGTVIYSNITYLYSPFEYKKSEVVPIDRAKFKNPVLLEICYNGWESECVYSTEKDDVKFIIESLQDLDFVTKSREEFRELDYSNVDLSDVSMRYYYDNQYNVVIREYEKTNDGYELGSWIFSFDFYTFSKFVNAYGGTFYYFELPQGVREFVYNADENPDFIDHETMFKD